MAASEHESATAYSKLSLEELERQYTEAAAKLTSIQKAEVERGNLAMSRQFPLMRQAYHLYAALQQKKRAQSFDAMNRIF